eukprot:TRINITY_DN41497_c0_g1_i1.p1 TRINITY_DN41497_c0_g1~~TRINITY_DN41497_c0_g1_i1.p1  ORF type:complete len:185 (+),score=47.60 TRINITY_DN41497_c0_g1_i1:68-622(+)
MDAARVLAMLRHIDGVLRSADFKSFHADFIEAHCEEFEDTEENQLSWMTRHIEFVELAETRLERSMRNTDFGDVHDVIEALPAFLASNAALELDAQSAAALDFVISLTDFEDFKDTMLARKAARNIALLERYEARLAREAKVLPPPPRGYADASTSASASASSSSSARPPLAAANSAGSRPPRP